MSTKKICKAKKSKRQSTKDRIKKDKKIVSSQRRMRKEAKKLKKLGVVKRKSNNDELKVPNLCPYKKTLLENLKRRKDGLLLEKELSKKNELLERTNMLENAVALNKISESLDVMEIENEENVNTDESVHHVRNRLKPIKYIFENADVVLEILDSRDPMGCRCRNVERQFQTEYPDKKIILVLNKIDLVPIEVAKAWKSILSREFPTVLFKSNLQEQSSNLSTNKLFNKSITDRPELAEELISSSKSVGAEKLLEIIKNYSRNDSGKVSSISIGVLGYPNVGKSSVINSLTKKRSVGVSSVAGYTKTIQEVDVDSKVTLIDSPGVVLSQENEIALVLRNTINPEEVKDLERAIAEILKRVKKEQLLKLYKISDYIDSKEFVIKVAQKKGKIRKGGILHLEETMRMILQDWNSGKISYYVPPPMIQKDEQQCIMINNENINN
mgnify:FL=1